MPSAVLVAEPEPETREYLGRQLRDDGFDVLGAARRARLSSWRSALAPMSSSSQSSTSAFAFGVVNRGAPGTETCR